MTPAAPRSTRRRHVVVLIAALLMLTGCKFDGAYDLPLPGNVVGDGESFGITVDFADALNVVPRTAVMVDDVPIGQVESVERVGWHARLVLRVRKDIDLPENAIAEVRQTSLLGEKYVALLPPSTEQAVSARLSDGDNIPLSATGRNPEVEEVLGALSMVLSGGGVGQLKTISVELNKMMDGRSDNLRHLLGQLDLLIGSLDDQKANIISALGSIDKLASTLNKEKATFNAALDSMGPALKALNRQHTALVTMLSELDKLGAVGSRVISGSRADIVATVKHLQPVLRGLVAAGDELPLGLATMVSFPFPEKAGTIAKGDYANALFKMTFDLNKLLADPVGELPDLAGLCYNIPQLSDVCDAAAATPPAAKPPANPLSGLTGGLGGLGNLLSGGGGSSATPPSGESGLLGLLGGSGGLLGGGG